MTEGRKFPKIAFAVPSKDEWKADMSVAFTALFSYTGNYVSPALAILNEKGSMIANQRNNLVDRSIELGCDYIFWLDSDVLVPPNTVQVLLSRDKDIVGATYNRRSPPFSTLGHLLGPQHKLTGGLEPADYLPGGCMLIRTDVYKKLKYPYYFETYKWAGDSPLDSFLRMLKDWSSTKIPDSVLSGLYNVKGIREWLEEQAKGFSINVGRIMSEDYNFCRKAIAHGFDIWCDIDITGKIAHIGEQQVTCQVEGVETKHDPLPVSPFVKPNGALHPEAA